MSLEIRPSTVGSMMLCPARQMLKDVDGFNRKPSEALVFGTLVHALLESHLRGSVMNPVFGVHDRLHEIWLADGGTDHEWRRLVSDEKKMSMADEAAVAYQKWKRNILPFLPTSEPIIERQMRTTIGVHPETNEAVEMYGTPDVVYPDDRLIIDWKTAGRGWDGKKMEGQVQPLAYNLLLEGALGVAEPFAFQFYVYDRKDESWKLHDYGVPDLRAVEAFQAQAFGMALLSEGEPVFTPQGQGWKTRGWHCDPRYCDAWAVCPGKWLINDGKANKRALRIQERGWE